MILSLSHLRLEFGLQTRNNTVPFCDLVKKINPLILQPPLAALREVDGILLVNDRKEVLKLIEFSSQRLALRTPAKLTGSFGDVCECVLS